MSIYYSLKDEGIKTGGACQVHESKKCFYCGRVVDYPRIMWGGATGDLFGHPVCVRKLCLRLLRDVWEWERDDLSVSDLGRAGFIDSRPRR